MTPSELLSDFDFGPGDTRQHLLSARLLLHYLADHVYLANLNSGDRVAGSDATTFKIWLHELSEEARQIARLPASSEHLLSVTREILPPAPQRRYDPTCPRCGHVHEGTAECGMPMGSGRFCRCEMEVVA